MSTLSDRTPTTFYLETLGCAKNVADSDGIFAVLTRAGFQSVQEPAQADVLVVNTCGFLQASRKESIQVLRALGESKKNGQLLIAVGCLISRYGEVVKTEAPQVDGIIDAGRWLAIPRLIEELANGNDGDLSWYGQAYTNLPLDQAMARSVTEYLPRRSTGPSAFLKIADGCDRPCTFCIIPAIKGRHRSKPMDAVIREAQELVDSGVRELVLVAQDTTAYGWDWGQRDQLAPLIESICERVRGLEWLRLMYAYPGHVTPRLIDTMARCPQVLHYLDIPLQHAHADVLQRMKRPNPATTRRMLDDLRAAMPDLAIRTTFIVGFPGETAEEFETLLEFMEEQQFDRVGIFEYSREAGTPSADLPHQHSRHEKEKRRRVAMTLQQRISARKNKKLVGANLDVLVEGNGELVPSAVQKNAEGAGEPISIGRTYRDAPEVDGLVVVKGTLQIGKIVRVRITDYTEYDLIGEVT